MNQVFYCDWLMWEGKIHVGLHVFRLLRVTCYVPKLEAHVCNFFIQRTLLLLGITCMSYCFYCFLKLIKAVFFPFVCFFKEMLSNKKQ